MFFVFTYTIRGVKYFFVASIVLSLTLYPNLPAGAVGAGQQGELFSLMHGIVCAGYYNLVSRFPGLLHFILQVQHHLVHSVHLEA